MDLNVSIVPWISILYYDTTRPLIKDYSSEVPSSQSHHGLAINSVFLPQIKLNFDAQ